MAQTQRRRNLFDSFNYDAVKRPADCDEESNPKKIRKPLADVGIRLRSRQLPAITANPIKNKVVILRKPSIIRSKTNVVPVIRRLRSSVVRLSDLVIHEKSLPYSCLRDDKPRCHPPEVKLDEITIRQIRIFNFDVYNGQDVAEDIVEYLFNLELRRQIPPEYLFEVRSSKFIDDRSRNLVINWLIQKQESLQMSQKTLHHTVMMIDRMLFMKELSVDVLQLLGLTSLFIISKLEERFPPQILHLLKMTGQAYQYAHVIVMERYILRKLKFDLIMADPMSFLQIYIYNVKKQDKVRNVCNYLLDTFLLNKESAVTLPSHLSAAAFYLACDLLFGINNDAWSSVLTVYLPNTAEQDIRNLVYKMLNFTIEVTQTNVYKAVKQRYSGKKFGCISLSPLLSTNFLTKLLQQMPEHGKVIIY